MNTLLLIIERDLRIFFQYKFLIVMRTIWFIAQVSFFGLIVTRLVTPTLKGIYFQYYVAGIIIMMLYSTSIFIGYDVYQEAEHGVIEYLLSLPVSRRIHVLGRSIGGGIRSFIFIGPLVVVALAIIGITNLLNFIIALFALFLFAVGVSGMSITIAVGLKSGDRFDILMGILDALIIRLSTVMYPHIFIQDANQLYAAIARFNPLTFASDLFRWGLGIEQYLSQPPSLALSGLVIFISTFSFISVIMYEKKLEGGGWQ